MICWLSSLEVTKILVEIMKLSKNSRLRHIINGIVSYTLTENLFGNNINQSAEFLSEKVGGTQIRC